MKISFKINLHSKAGLNKDKEVKQGSKPIVLGKIDLKCLKQLASLFSLAYPLSFFPAPEPGKVGLFKDRYGRVLKIKFYYILFTQCLQSIKLSVSQF